MYWIVEDGSDVMVGASANWSIRRGKARYTSRALSMKDLMPHAKFTALRGGLSWP